MMYNGILYHVWHIPRKGQMPEQDIVQVYIPNTLVDTIMYHCHDNVLSAHLGFHKTYSKVKQRINRAWLNIH